MGLLEKAILVATKAHEGQLDKGGQPYILHPLRVMLKLETEEERLVAILHDVLEDTEITSSDLLSAGFSSDVVFAVECLTRRNGESYMGFIKRLKPVTLSRSVKLADIEDNMDLSRISVLTDKDFERSKKYQKAVKELLS